MPFLRLLKVPFLLVMVPVMAYRYTWGDKKDGFGFGTNLVATTKWVIAYVPGGVPAGIQAMKDHLSAAGAKAKAAGG